ncbi:hypothetical protein [Kitasatospora sp. NPDC059571]|uniref:hypothetical protein n=1 Tax=Kitasatospora sp. NPDC059571 TaxID=3346871 RepID=UPI0036C757BF
MPPFRPSCRSFRAAGLRESECLVIAVVPILLAVLAVIVLVIVSASATAGWASVWLTRRLRLPARLLIALAVAAGQALAWRAVFRDSIAWLVVAGLCCLAAASAAGATFAAEAAGRRARARRLAIRYPYAGPVAPWAP